MTVKKGNTIKVEYTGTFEDGTVFDSSEKHGQPLEFKVGEGNMIKGFDEAVVGMKKDEEKEITLTPDQAYGEPKPEATRKFPRDQLPKDKEIKQGMTLVMSTPQGHQIPVKVSEVDEKEVTLDLNHPLAGKTLKFKIKVVEISAA